jgi:formate--tetrahydrofolate ligase
MLKAAGPMAVLLREALKPNLAQTLEGTPAIIHGGPFANIAHGCSSVLATRMALKLGEICVTEAGFGADLGAEKFLDIKMRKSGLAPDLSVLVATIRALKMHGGVPLPDLKIENLQALRDGFVNLRCHAENLRKYGLPVVVAINRFPTDTPAEIELLIDLCGEMGIRAVEADVWGQGGVGAEELARQVQQALTEPAHFRTLYPNDMPLRGKIETIAREIYRAGHVEYLAAAARSLDGLQERGFGNLPICVAKTQYSFSDNPALKGAPTGHTLTIRDAKLSAGAGFVVVYAGSLLTMPGLPRVPAGDAMDLTDSGAVIGLF